MCIRRLLRRPLVLALITQVSGDQWSAGRGEEWLRWFEKHPVPSLQHVAEVLQAPATEDVLEEVWTEVEQIETETPEMLTGACILVTPLGRPQRAFSSPAMARRRQKPSSSWQDRRLKAQPYDLPLRNTVDDAELLLSMFGFLAATSGLHGDLATRALQWAAEGRGRGALEASLYSTSMKGLLPFASLG
eukprot:g11045.t1